ncbi:MAG: chitosanase [Cyanobacteria bacterium REEB67]|nr:chitosanase [Cyanobacteria bacterium REEB67]
MVNDGHHKDVSHPEQTHKPAEHHQDLIHHAYEAPHTSVHSPAKPSSELLAREHAHKVAGAKEGSKVTFTSSDLATARDFNKGYGSCGGEWTNMVEKWVTHNEVAKKKYEVYTPNDAGHGISVGILQWNQKRGSLTELLREWHHKDPAKFDHTFGKYSASLMNVDFVKKADFNKDPILNRGMKASLADHEFQQVQLGLRYKQLAHSCDVAQDHGFKSLRGRAVVADLFNQMGPNGTVKAMEKVPANKNESVRIEQLKKLTGNRPHGHDRVSLIEDQVKEVWRQIGHGTTG